VLPTFVNTAPTMPPTLPDYVPGEDEYVVIYNQIEYKEQFHVGGCLPWLQYITRYLKLAHAYSQYPIQIDVMGIPNTHLSRPSTITCNDSVIADRIVQQMIDPSTETVSITCNNAQWKVKDCNGMSQAGFCVNCQDPCMTSNYNSTVPYIISPCGVRPGHFPMAAYMAVTIIDTLSAPMVRNLVVTAGKNSFGIDVTINKQGMVYCAAFRAGTLVSYVEQAFAQNHILYAANNQASFLIENLIPLTEYDVYCYTSNIYSGSSLSLHKTLATKHTVFTQCCRSIYVDVVTPRMYKNTVDSGAVVVSVEAPPNYGDDVTLELAMSYQNEAGETVIVSSSNIQFTDNFFGAIRVPVSENVTAHVGTITLTATVTGGTSMFKYNVEYRKGTQSAIVEHRRLLLDGENTITVMDSDEEPPVPVMQSATMSGDGSYSIVTFDSNTDRAGVTTSSFDCSVLLQFTHSEMYTCSWGSDASVIIRPLTSMNVLPIGEDITLIDGVLSARCPESLDCSAWSSAPSATVTLVLPTSGSMISPVVHVSGPTVISTIDELTIDLSYSTGAGNRAWKSIHFEVHSKTQETQALVIEEYLNTHYLYKPPSAIPSELLFKGGYNIIVTMCTPKSVRCGGAKTLRNR